MKIAICILLACSPLWAQSAANSAATPSDPALTQLLAELQVTALKSDGDIARLRFEKWKADSAAKQQAQATANSIRRNLTAAVPELIQGIQLQPNSLSANFRLYRDMNALYDTFSSLVESAGAFGPAAEYNPLDTDMAQFDQIRHRFAERMDLLAGATDAELLRLRQSAAATPAKPAVSRVVVDDNQPAAKNTKNKKKTKTPPPAQPNQ